MPVKALLRENTITEPSIMRSVLLPQGHHGRNNGAVFKKPRSIWSFTCPVLHFVHDSSSIIIQDSTENAFVISLGKSLSLQKLV